MELASSDGSSFSEPQGLSSSDGSSFSSPTLSSWSTYDSFTTPPTSPFHSFEAQNVGSGSRRQTGSRRHGRSTGARGDDRTAESRVGDRIELPARTPRRETRRSNPFQRAINTPHDAESSFIVTLKKTNVDEYCRLVLNEKF